MPSFDPQSALQVARAPNDHCGYSIYRLPQALEFLRAPVALRSTILNGDYAGRLARKSFWRSIASPRERIRLALQNYW